MAIYNDELSSFITQTFAPEDNSLVHIRQQIEASWPRGEARES